VFFYCPGLKPQGNTGLKQQGNTGLYPQGNTEQKKQGNTHPMINRFLKYEIREQETLVRLGWKKSFTVIDRNCEP